VLRERWFQLLNDVVLALGCLGHLALLYAIGSLHQTEPDAFETMLIVYISAIMHHDLHAIQCLLQLDKGDYQIIKLE